ncbi:hypothetical protein NW762_012867 [Fusarium torreyae]|uniref:Uncharacterized protein n=1 Tax=Fusarium torreyae TaxID=1237075 RepID=A0A9W8RQU5_9HYPO|nr:hypothetical protein NW762_012867 [Fusarium torreyae]
MGSYPLKQEITILNLSSPRRRPPTSSCHSLTLPTSVKMRQRAEPPVTCMSSYSSSLRDDDSVFDSDEYMPSALDTDPTDDSDVESQFKPEAACRSAKRVSDNSASGLGADEGKSPSKETDHASCSDDLSDADLDPDDFLQIEADLGNDGTNQAAYSRHTLKGIDGIEWRWNKYCVFTKRDPKTCLQNLDYGKIKSFFIWICQQKKGVDEAGPGSPHRLMIKFSLRFTKRFLGAKNTHTFTLPEIIFDDSLLLSPHILLLGLMFRHRAFEASSLVSPEHLSSLDIYPGEDYLLLPLKKSMDDVFVFRDTVKTALGGYELSQNTPITYAEICEWTKAIGVLAGFIIVTILYTLRYNTANELDGSPNVSDALRNLVLDHANSIPFGRHYLARNVSVDTLAIVRHKEQQNTLIRKSTSVGYLASKRRPTKLTAQQSEAVNDDPRIQKLLRLRESLRQAEKSSETRQKLRNITQDLQYLRGKLRRERKREYRQGWSQQQAVVDIERHIAGQGFEEPPPDGTPAQRHPAQRRLFEALTAPVIGTSEGERCRRNDAILAVMAYCPIEEPQLLYNKSFISHNSNTPIEETQADREIATAMASVYVKSPEERSRRCFLCVGKATTLASSDPLIKRLIQPFYSSGDLTMKICVVAYVIRN